VDSISRELRDLIVGLPILKVNIYNLDGLTMFSTQHAQVGEQNSADKGLVAAAIGGKISSRMTEHSSFISIDGAKFDVTAVSTYTPVQDIHGKVRAVFEIHTDATAMMARLNTKLWEIAAVTTAIFLVGFGLFLILFRHADAVIRSQHRELQEAHDELSEKNRRLKTANDAKSDFFARVSYDLRTPLNGILGFAQILKDESFGPIDNPRYREYVSHIRDSGITLRSMVDDMLDISRIEAGDYPLNITPLNLIALVDRVHKSLDARWEARGLRFTVDGEPSLPLVQADERATMHIIRNLLENAICHSDDNEVIQVVLKRDIETGKVVLSISDQGPLNDDVAPDDALDPYYQKTNAYLTGDAESDGFSISVVQSLIELQGGHLRLGTADNDNFAVELEFNASPA
jgi:signal transduction histidine kinase